MIPTEALPEGTAMVRHGQAASIPEPSSFPDLSRWHGAHDGRKPGEIDAAAIPEHCETTANLCRVAKARGSKQGVEGCLKHDLFDSLRTGSEDASVPPRNDMSDQKMQQQVPLTQAEGNELRLQIPLNK